MCAGIIYRNSDIVLRQFKAPNEHKFDCLFALLVQFLMRTKGHFDKFYIIIFAGSHISTSKNQNQLRLYTR